MYSRLSSEPSPSQAEAVVSEASELPVSYQGPIELAVEPGTVIAGKYRVVRRIGTGGMGQVFSAIHLELGEHVALKFLRREAMAHPELVRRFALEARAAARIRSEHVARVFDVGQLEGGVPFIVMEFLEGQDLAEVIAERGALPIQTAVDYMLQVCEGLASAHAKGIVHRDIKPENIFLASAGSLQASIKILDFGVSKVALDGSIAPSERRFVQTTLPVGSPAYMSPEQIRDCGEVDQRTDIWSLGCTFFEILTRKVPFDAPTLVQLGVAILEQEPVPLRRERPGAPLELEAIIARCLSKDPDARFSNVAEVAQALAPFASERARIYAERCNFLFPLDPCGEPQRGVTHDSIPALARDPSRTVPAMGLRVRTEATGRRRWRLGGWLALGVAAVGAWSLSRSPIDVPPIEATAASAAPALAATVTTPLPQPEPVVNAELDAALLPTTTTVARPAMSVRPRPPAPKAPRRITKRVFGQARDESFDVGY